MGALSRAELDALVDEATVDAYNDDEQLTGLYTLIEEHLAVPFTTRVLGVEVVVRRVDLRHGAVVAVCHRGRVRQAIGILDLPLPEPSPAGTEWVEADRHWVNG
ncbi:Calcium binding [Micromonospora purpureochromogenes]|uniref:Calcium binding n=1 Tax=Micromonospora purpureochromogenes TaxID=47872 RepID=A0A1C4UCI7_9ACTN|nr:calcium-binding protein [Micromonospora purpureochromogenes]SCE69393.1 Calcium binding [Micromonospora purpureochromogenes]